MVLTAAVVTGCGTQGADEKLTVWSLESQPARVATLQKLGRAFTQQSGTPVEVVPVDEDQYNQLVVSSAAAGELPDVIAGLDLTMAAKLATNGLLDTKAANNVINRLGPDTFMPRTLQRATFDGRLAAVPSDSWTSVLVYRKDLFRAAGLKPPTDYESIRAAAAKLDGHGRVGFAGLTETRETFEHLALANGCQLVGNQGEVTIDTPQCKRAFTFYNTLISKYSAAGLQDSDSVRSMYLSGRAAMAVYSSYLLDELAGLQPDLVPSCDECVSDPAYLAKNSGVVTTITGPDGAKSQFGKQANWAITADASAPADDFVAYMMSEGYEEWIAMSPEGKVPNRQGTRTDPTAYVDAWRSMRSGEQPRAPLSNFYAPPVINDIAKSPASTNEWAIEQDQADLLGAILGEQPIVQALSQMFNESLSPTEAAEQARRDVESIQESLR
ncbi:ABC transporter substrate-binding protein [Parasphingorhabdus pacifica]